MPAHKNKASFSGPVRASVGRGWLFGKLCSARRGGGGVTQRRRCFRKFRAMRARKNFLLRANIGRQAGTQAGASCLLGDRGRERGTCAHHNIVTTAQQHSTQTRAAARRSATRRAHPRRSSDSGSPRASTQRARARYAEEVTAAAGRPACASCNHEPARHNIFKSFPRCASGPCARACAPARLQIRRNAHARPARPTGHRRGPAGWRARARGGARRGSSTARGVRAAPRPQRTPLVRAKPKETPIVARENPPKRGQPTENSTKAWTKPALVLCEGEVGFCPPGGGVSNLISLDSALGPTRCGPRRLDTPTDLTRSDVPNTAPRWLRGSRRRTGRSRARRRARARRAGCRARARYTRAAWPIAQALRRALRPPGRSIRSQARF